jgi:hypothetical protein
MSYAIARAEKRKGSSVASAGKHTDRTRETPNADREKRHENRLLIGDGRTLREVVTEKINAYGGKPRRDSVECVELMFTASPEFFLDEKEDTDKKKVAAFSEKTVEFLRERYGHCCVKAVLHMDEHTPHIHAFMVPIDGRGKLNCKAFFGTREKLRKFQTEYARKMEPLGLERGVERSRAKHTQIQRFYGTIMEAVELKVDHTKIHDPPAFMTSEQSRRDYKLAVIAAVNEQVSPALTTMRNQALLAVDERRKRGEVEKRAEERIREAEKWAEERVEKAEETTKTAFEHFAAEHEENQLLKEENESLRTALAGEKNKTQELGEQVRGLSELVRDIPLAEVMSRMSNYRGERQGEAVVFYAQDGRSAVVVIGNKAYTHENELVAETAVDLVMRAGPKSQEGEVTPREALLFLAEEFGKDRALAATAAYTRDVAARVVEDHDRHVPGGREEHAPRQAEALEHDHEEALMH